MKGQIGTACGSGGGGALTSTHIDLGQGLELLGVEERVADMPKQAHVRGIFFELARQAVAARSSDLLATWRAACRVPSRWAVMMYPASDFIRELAVAAVLLEPEDPGSALRKMWVETPRLSPLIRAEGFIRYLTGSNPESALSWVARNRRMMCNFGRWRVEFPGPRRAIFHLEDEYVWLQYCQAGGAEGTLRRCGVSPTVSAELDDPYNGRLLIAWE